ncbi:MAG TPA: GFA family protein [Geminicoccaceae bacterium]|nr:GFA family protein [Geminicoccaceae bacterium]
MPIRGSCHCGRIAYRLDAVPTEAITCNCSICQRKGSVLAAFAPEQFHLETSRDDIAVYTFNRHVIRHQFCKTCGCAPFAEGTAPDGEAMVVLNLRCAEDVDLTKIRITPFDGASL